MHHSKVTTVIVISVSTGVEEGDRKLDVEGGGEGDSLQNVSSGASAIDAWMNASVEPVDHTQRDLFGPL